MGKVIVIQALQGKGGRVGGGGTQARCFVNNIDAVTSAVSTRKTARLWHVNVAAGYGSTKLAHDIAPKGTEPETRGKSTLNTTMSTCHPVTQSRRERAAKKLIRCQLLLIQCLLLLLEHFDLILKSDLFLYD